LVAVDACTTRLRLSIADQKAVDEAALRTLGARGFVRPSQQTLQVVVGPIADQLASSIRAGLKLPANIATPAVAASVATDGAGASEVSADNLLQRLGGSANIRELRAAASRLCFIVADDAAISDDLAQLTGIRGVVRPMANSLHVVVGPAAPALLAELGRLRSHGAR
jgi:PTS system N-acetylglucosamine-specific IIC component